MCTERYISPFTDFGFKYLFGTKKAKPFLISLLNSLLNLSDPIAEIQYENTERFGLTPSDRKAVYDLYCTTVSGKHIIVEMHNAGQRYFVDRSIYYSTFPMVETAQKGDWDFELPTVYFIAFLNFKMEDYKLDSDFKHVVKLIDTKTGRVFYDKLTYIYLEMPKFDKKIDELEEFSDKWIYVIKNMNQLDEYPEEIQEEIFREFFKLSEISALGKKERHAYEQSLKELRDYNNTLNFAMESGMEKGMEKGREEEKIAIARNLKRVGVSTAVIAKTTGLTEDQINSL